MTVNRDAVRRLERPLRLYVGGRISRGRWQEVLQAWTHGEDVHRWDFGTVESLAERIVAVLDGQTVDASTVVKWFHVDRPTASAALSRLARRRSILKMKYGSYVVVEPTL